jgi:hypothetical protein
LTYKENYVADSPETPGTPSSPSNQQGYTPVPQYQPVPVTPPPAAAPASAGYQVPPPPPVAPVKSGGSSALKIILIVVAVFVGLGILGVSVVGYGIYRVAHAVHVSGSGNNEQVTVNTPGGSVNMNTSEKYTSGDLGTDIYPGAQPAKGGMRMTLPTGSMVSAAFTTSDSSEQVVAFYKTRFGSDATVVETGDGAMLTVNKGKQESVILTITQKPNELEGKTQIHIVHTINIK